MPWRMASWIVAFSGLAALSVFIYALFERPGELSVTTDPLTWPQASPLLLLGVLALAIPALLLREEQS